MKNISTTAKKKYLNKIRLKFFFFEEFTSGIFHELGKKTFPGVVFTAKKIMREKSFGKEKTLMHL
jgi:hypothetical protein